MWSTRKLSKDAVGSEFRARTRVVTIMPYASLFNLLRPAQTGRKLWLFSVQAQSRSAATRVSNTYNVDDARDSITQLAMCETVVDMDARRPLVWQDRTKAKAVTVVSVLPVMPTWVDARSEQGPRLCR